MRRWMLVLVLPFLAGCTDADWNKLLSFGPSGNGQSTAQARPATVATAAPAAIAAPAPAPAPAQPNPFCLGVARQDATTNDFDTPTQQKAAVESYQQCVAIFGN